MNKKQVLAVAALVGMFSLVAMPRGFAFGPGFGHEGNGEECLAGKFFYKVHFLLEQKDALGLSEEQVQTIHTMKMDVKKQMIRQGAEMQVLSLDIESQLHEKQVDVAGVQKLIDQKYEIKKALDKSAVEAFAKLKTTITEKQWDDLKKLKSERMEKHFGRHEHERME